MLRKRFNWGHWGNNAPLALLVSLFGYILWHALITGQIDTNRKVFSRHSETRAYWFYVSLFALFYLMTAVGMLASPER